MCTIFFLLRLALIFFCFIFLNEPHRIVRVSIDIAEKYKTTVLGDHRQEKKKRNEKKDSPSWIGTSTRGTTQLNFPENSTPQLWSPGWIRASIRVNIQNCGTSEQAKLLWLPTFSYPRSRHRNMIPRRWEVEKNRPHHNKEANAMWDLPP